MKEDQCAAEVSFKMFGARWKPFIIRQCILEGKCSYSDLKTAISEINDSSLANQLQSMVEDGLLAHSDSGYFLTEMGRDLDPILERLADFAVENGYEEHENSSAIEYSKALIGNKWTARIIWAIYQSAESARFNQLQRDVKGISHKMLAEKLKSLEESGFVIRTDHQTKEPWTDYTLTETGLSAYAAIDSMQHFCRKYGLVDMDSL